MAKRFFYVCGGLLMLALAYHFGATTATAQAAVGGPIVGIASDGSAQGRFVAVNQEGDTYFSLNDGHSWTFNGNIYSSPTPTTRESWGQVKSRYR